MHETDRHTGRRWPRSPADRDKGILASGRSPQVRYWGWSMRLRPTMSLLLATPLGVRPSFFDMSRSRGVSMPLAAMT